MSVIDEEKRMFHISPCEHGFIVWQCPYQDPTRGMVLAVVLSKSRTTLRWNFVFGGAFQVPRLDLCGETLNMQFIDCN